MKRVFIDRQKGVVLINGKKIPELLLRMMRGAVGKRFVVKQYKGGRVVVTRYPDMCGIVASDKQRERRDLFREAVVYARWIVGDEKRKKAFRKTLPRKSRTHVYQAAIRLYMSRQGDAQWLRKQLAVKSMLRSGEKEMIGVKAMIRIYTEDMLLKSSNVVWWRFLEEGVHFLDFATSPNTRFWQSGDVARISKMVMLAELAGRRMKGNTMDGAGVFKFPYP